NAQSKTLREAAEALKCAPAQVPKRLEAVQGELRQAQREIESLRGRLARFEAAELAERAKTVAGVKLVAARVKADGADALRGMADELKARLGSAVIVLGASSEGRVNFVAAATPDAVARGVHAGKL